MRPSSTLKSVVPPGSGARRCQRLRRRSPGAESGDEGTLECNARLVGVDFAIIWVPGIGEFIGQMPGQPRVPVIFFKITALLSSLSFIIPLALAVWYLGKPDANDEP